MTDLIAGLLRANVAASLAILLVFAIRLPARHLFGAEIAYRLWLVAPLAFGASLIPATEAPAGAAGPSLPFGCYWPAPLRHPLGARVAMLKKARPSHTRAMAGFWIVSALSCASGFGACPPSPPHVRWLDLPDQAAKRQARATVVVISMTPDQVKVLTRAAV